MPGTIIFWDTQLCWKFIHFLPCPEPLNTDDNPINPNATRVLESLNLGSSLKSLLLLHDAHLSLGAHDATTPLSADLVVLLQVAILDGRDELGQLVLVLGADLSEGEDGSGLCQS